MRTCAPRFAPRAWLMPDIGSIFLHTLDELGKQPGTLALIFGRVGAA